MDIALKVSPREMICPLCGVPMFFIRERTEVTVDGMRFSLWDYWCPRDGLWHFNPDTKELTQKTVKDFEEF